MKISQIIGHQPQTINNLQPQTNQTQQQSRTSNNNNSPIPTSPTDKNNPFNGLLTNKNIKNLVPWQSTTGKMYELPQEVVTEISGYRNSFLQEIKNIKQTTQECLQLKLVIEQQAKELASGTKVGQTNHSIPVSVQLNKKQVHVNDTFDINYFNEDFQPSLVSTIAEKNNRHLQP